MSVDKVVHNIIFITLSLRSVQSVSILVTGLVLVIYTIFFLYFDKIIFEIKE